LGTGRVIIKTENRKFVLCSITTQHKAPAYNRKPIPHQSHLCPSLVPLDILEDDAVPTDISGNACAHLFNFMKPKYKATVPTIKQAYL
jgi:hypothetical protein